MKRESLNGTIPNESKLVAYCKLHKVSLTVRQMKNKACLQKACFHLSKYKHPYWEQREILKARKKAKKKG